MQKVTISLDSIVIQFYSILAAKSNLSLEQILSDALFKLAAELSLEAIHKANKST